MDSVQEELVRRIMEQQSRQAGDYILDVKAVPREDSEELLEFLLHSATEENE